MASMRILVAADDPAALSTVFSVIPSGYVVFDVHDGEDTLTRLVDASERVNPFDLLVLDLELPKLDGLKVLSLLRSLEEPRRLAGGRCTRVLVVGNSPEAHEIYSAHTLLCDGFLVKPLEPKKIARELERLCPRV